MAGLSQKIVTLECPHSPGDAVQIGRNNIQCHCGRSTAECGNLISDREIASSENALLAKTLPSFLVAKRRVS
jgi:hypothetical protein